MRFWHEILATYLAAMSAIAEGATITGGDQPLAAMAVALAPDAWYERVIALMTAGGLGVVSAAVRMSAGMVRASDVESRRTEVPRVDEHT